MTIRSKLKNWLLLAGVWGAFVGCGGALEPTNAGVEEKFAGVTLMIEPGAELEFDQSANEDYETLAQDVSLMSATLGLGGSADDTIRVVFTGKGRIIDREDYQDTYKAKMDADVAAAADAEDIVHWDTVSLQSGNEFRVEFPRAVLRAAGERAEKEGLNLGSERVSESIEREGPQVPVPPKSGYDLLFGWSNADDGRVLRGTYDVAQTHDAYEKLVRIGGGCSGTMVGPKHIVTAAHCIRDYENSAWGSSTARAGRSGSAWRDSVSFNTSNTWYWTPSQFRTLSDGLEDMPFSATPYDIGVIVTHDRRMGNTVGWMGWYWWGSDSDFGNKVRYNRGYPVCGTANNNDPEDCLPHGLYGDTAFCAAGEYSSPDGDGINRRFRFHCDISGGHSGSSLYHYLNGETLVVTGIVSWEHCYQCTVGDDRPNTGVRITSSYSDSISWLRQTFP